MINQKISAKKWFQIKRKCRCSKKRNELLEEVKVISAKGLKQDLTNKDSILDGAKYFSSGLLQNYLVFISADKYVERFIGSQPIYSWKSKGIPKEIIKNMP